ncbi:hypothetical protein [Wolbachia endosymbiont of Folsomia candida]|uniref:hypothetical protein n=1 Tax=Wolbachia endosymbiont of Folsomia candida TaxID=169402 RepID=UPI000DBF0FE5|nr:hypothetical protein [Wolbachia endosymbiont of Folsomia candida]AWW50854.1 hypothetical protein ASM33_08375 [Wolbachia endosymbiont of Folsomia candida]
MLNIAKSSFIRAVIRAYLGRSIDLYQKGLLSLYSNEVDLGETYEEAKEYIEETLLKREVNNFTKILVKKDIDIDADLSHIVNNLFRSFDIKDALDNLRCKIPFLLHAVDELLSIFITLRFDQTGNIRKNITFEQVAKITQAIASKMEHDWFYIAPRNISTIVRYLEIVAKEVELSSGVMTLISELKSCTSLDDIGEFTIKDLVTADILLNVVLSTENHTKKCDYYRQLIEIIAEILSFSDRNEETEEIKDFFVNLPRDGLIKLAHYKDSFLKLLKSDKRFSLKQVSNIILQLVDSHILDLTLSADRKDSPKEIENFIIGINAILSNSPANVYSQTDIDNFIKKSQIRNGIVCGNLPGYVRSLNIYPIYYHSHPIFYHFLNRLIGIKVLSLERIKRFIQIIASNTTNIVNNDTFTYREFLFNDFRNIILNKPNASFGVDYIILQLIRHHVSIEEIGEFFSELLKLRGYCGLYQLLYEEYHLLNTSVKLYCYMKNNVSLSIKEFAIPFIKQFINGAEKFNPEFWKREYIPGILAMPTALQHASSDAIMKMLMTLKSDLQDCYSYRDIIEHAFTTEQSSSRFFSWLANLSKIDGCALVQKAAQQILNDEYDPKEVRTLIELSMNQLINNIASLALKKMIDNEQPSSSLCDVRLSNNVNREKHGR